MAASGKRGKRRVAMPLPPPVGIADTTETPAPKKKRKKIASSQPQLSSAAHQLAAIGPKTEALLSQLRLDSDRVGLFADLTDEGLVELANALQEGWPDDQAATI